MQPTLLKERLLMTKPLLAALALLIIGNGAVADHISVYAHPAGICCRLETLAVPPAINTLYIVHKFNFNGAAASQFKVSDTSGLFATTQTTPFLSIGLWNTDLSLSYGACLTGDILVMTLNFLWFGNPITGCNNQLVVVPAPTSAIPGEIATVECDFQTLVPATGGRFVIDPTSTCGGVCGDLEPCPPVATESRTWGGIKALYQ